MDDLRFLLGGAVGALLIPVLAFVFHVPFLLAALAGGAVFAAAVLLLRPRQPFENLDAQAIGNGQLQAAQAILAQAYKDIDAIAATAGLMPDKAMGDSLKRLVVQARAAAADVEAHPVRLAAVRRLLTYYVPSTRDIATNYAEIAGKTQVPADQTQKVKTALAQLENTYAHFRQQSFSGETQELDVDLDLLNRSIKQDLEKI